MRIGCVTTSYPRSAGDPAGAFVATRVATLRARGHEVEVVAAGPVTVGSASASTCVLADTSPISRLPATLFSGAGAPEELEAGGARAWFSALGFTMRMIEAVRTRLSAWDAVESHWLVPSTLSVVLAARAPKVSGARPIAHQAIVHSGDVALLERVPFGAALARYVLARVDRLCIVSHDLCTRLQALCGPDIAYPPIQIAPMAISPCFARERLLRSHVTSAPEAPIVLGVGRLVPIKAFDRLILAVGRMPHSIRPRLVILGEGPERPRLLRLAHALKVDLDLPGAVPPAEVAAWMARATVCVLPSRRLPNGRREGAPLVLREALAMGLPIIVSAEALDEGTQPAPPGSDWGQPLRIWRGGVESLAQLVGDLLGAAPRTTGKAIRHFPP